VLVCIFGERAFTPKIWPIAGMNIVSVKVNEGVILRAEIRLDENEFLDLEHPSYKDALSLFAKTRPSEISPADDAGELGVLYNLFIGELETAAQQKYKVCQVRLPAPPKCPSYPTFLLGNPLAYVVRDPTCIHLVNLEDR